MTDSRVISNPGIAHLSPDGTDHTFCDLGEKIMIPLYLEELSKSLRKYNICQRCIDKLTPLELLAATEL